VFLPCTCLCFLHTTTTGNGCVVVYQIEVFISYFVEINPLNAELNPICHLLALLGDHHIFHISGLRVNPQVYEQVQLRCSPVGRKLHVPCIWRTSLEDPGSFLHRIRGCVGVIEAGNPPPLA
jgi:hypothetical protein